MKISYKTQKEICLNYIKGIVSLHNMGTIQADKYIQKCADNYESWIKEGVFPICESKEDGTTTSRKKLQIADMSADQLRIALNRAYNLACFKPSERI